MLRITTTHSGQPTTLKFEGKLLAPWVTEAVLTVTHARQNANLVRLDLTHLTFVDDAGIDLLHNFIRDGVEIVSCSPFIAELLKVGKP